jgi:hypothetical protein
MIQVDITTEEDAVSLEHTLTRINRLNARYEVMVRLARNLRWDFLTESRVAAAIATIAAHHDLIVCDWYHRWREDDIEEQFATSLVGMSSVFHAKRLTNVPGQEMPGSRRDFIERVAKRSGILEPRGGRGKSVTFCAFDPDWGEPAALAGTLGRKELFRTTFAHYREENLEVGKVLGFTPTTLEADSRLADFVFELYQNTYEHGRRKDSRGKPLPGFRYVRLRRYIDQKSGFLSRSAGFPELTEYFESVVPNETFQFYEIAISDTGLGLVAGFLASRRNFHTPDLPNMHEWLANELLTTALTSKEGYPGAGLGLPNALEAICELQGFISLRTDDLWLCGHSQEETPLKKKGLTKVRSETRFSSISGTHFNILLPLRRA